MATRRAYRFTGTDQAGRARQGSIKATPQQLIKIVGTWHGDGWTVASVTLDGVKHGWIRLLGNGPRTHWWADLSHLAPWNPDRDTWHKPAGQRDWQDDKGVTIPLRVVARALSQEAMTAGPLWPKEA